MPLYCLCYVSAMGVVVLYICMHLTSSFFFFYLGWLHWWLFWYSMHNAVYSVGCFFSCIGCGTNFSCAYWLLSCCFSSFTPSPVLSSVTHDPTFCAHQSLYPPLNWTETPLPTTHAPHAAALPAGALYSDVRKLPATPTNLRAVLVSRRFITVSWQRPENSGPDDIIAYSVYWSAQGSER